MHVSLDLLGVKCERFGLSTRILPAKWRFELDFLFLNYFLLCPSHAQVGLCCFRLSSGEARERLLTHVGPAWETAPLCGPCQCLSCGSTKRPYVRRKSPQTVFQCILPVFKILFVFLFSVDTLSNCGNVLLN